MALIASSIGANGDFFRRVVCLAMVARPAFSGSSAALASFPRSSATRTTYLPRMSHLDVDDVRLRWRG